jgi:hypothetical protein
MLAMTACHTLRGSRLIGRKRACEVSLDAWLGMDYIMVHHPELIILDL